MAASVAQTLYYEQKFVTASEQLTKLLADGPDMEQKQSIPLRLNLAISQFASAETGQRESATKVLFDAINEIIQSTLTCSENTTNAAATRSTESTTTYTAAQIDTVLSILTPESFVTFFNFAALLFRYHQYESCRQVLERLVNFLDVEPQDSAASVRVCFLLLEVLLREWNDCVVAHTEEQFSTFQSQAFHMLAAAEQYILLTLHEIGNTSSIPPSLQASVSAVASVIDLSTIEFSGDPLLLLGNVLKYRIKLYRCRVNLAIGMDDYVALNLTLSYNPSLLLPLYHSLPGLLTDAESDITQALTIYDRVLRPIADNPSLIAPIAASTDATSVDASSTSSPSSSSSLENHVTALASYLGGVNLHDVSDTADQHVDAHLQRQLQIGLYVQGELHFRMGRYETSLSSLKQAANTGTWMINNAANGEFRGQWEGKELEYLNNAACIHMNQKRYHAACLFMQKAMVRLSQPLSAEKDNANVYQPTLPYVNAMAVIYNAGLACLYADNPYGAFQCFEKTVPELHARPILWLRMAECCIRHHTSSSPSSSSKLSVTLKDTSKAILSKDHSSRGKHGTSPDRLLSPVAGIEGRGRRFVINLPGDEVEEASDVAGAGAGGSWDKDATMDVHAAVSIDINCNSTSTTATTTTTSEKSGCSIARASQYLNNALFLMRTARATNKTTPPSECGSPLPNGETNAVNYYPTGGSVGMDTLEVTALLQLSYVYLLQHNPVAALTASNEILAQSKLTEAGGHDTRYVSR